MNEFIAIDFETANPKRVSACSIGVAHVSNGNIVDSYDYLIKPVGGHAAFQSKIHGIKHEHTHDKPQFDILFNDIKDIFRYPLIGYSKFDEQVLNALSVHFSLGISFSYIDCCSQAKEALPILKNHKLKTVAKHFKLTPFKHHDAKEDAIACANIFLNLQEISTVASSSSDVSARYELVGLAKGIIADDEVNYKEVSELLYWLEDHRNQATHLSDLSDNIKTALRDGTIDDLEESEIKKHLESIIRNN
jgi:DNA polymerase III subunit epsilon